METRSVSAATTIAAPAAAGVTAKTTRIAAID